MAIPAALRLGCVKYLNARPLIYGWSGPVHFDHPSALCRRLAAGELDVALVSSFEYLRHPIYSIVDRLAIASDGPVFSVILVHLGAIEELREVVVDPASETSVNLLRCLLAERGLEARFVSDGEIGRARGQLLIGDQAIRFRQQSKRRHHLLDLGAEWKVRMKTPFVYALWLIHPDYAEKSKIAGALRSLGKQNLDHLDTLVAVQPEADRAFCKSYYRDCLRFNFGDAEKAGFKRFGELCAQQQLLPAAPPALRLV